MKKLIIIVLIVSLAAVMIFIFKDTVKNTLSGGRDKIIDIAVRQLESRYHLPPGSLKQATGVLKNMDAGTIQTLISNPQEMLSGKGKASLNFLNTSEGKKIKEMIEKGKLPKQ
jgi:hypothetical protein